MLDAVISFVYKLVVFPFAVLWWLVKLPFRMLGFFKPKTETDVDACPRFADIPEVAETDKIDAAWPPAPHPVEALSVQDLIRANGKLIRNLCYATTLSEEESQRYLLPVITNLAKIVHLTPASEYDHHQGYGGLFTHTLEVAYYAANDAKTTIFDRSANPKDLHNNKRRWILTAVLAALTHDIGKPFTDMEITAPNGLHWVRDEPLVDWLRKNRIENYYISFRPGREHNQHKSAALANSSMLIPKETLSFLGATGYGEQMLKEFRSAILEGRAGGLIGRILDNADGLSRNVDGLRQRQIRPEFKNVAHPQGDQLLKAIRVLIQSARWTTNKDAKSRIFITKQGCYIVWSEEVATEARAQALDMGYESLPADFLRLGMILVEAGAAVRNSDEVSNTHNIFWRMTPIVLGNVQFDCIRLADP
ncbi:MAG: MobH family relaxase, partial [Sutterellaceae bacterium]|nr:MobH family relaxase [Sutterellaceae bacterium]